MKVVKFKDMEEGKRYIIKSLGNDGGDYTKIDGLLYSLYADDFSSFKFHEATKFEFVEIKEPDERVKQFLGMLNEKFTHVAMDRDGVVSAYTTGNIIKGAVNWYFDSDNANQIKYEHVSIDREHFDLDFSFLSFEDEKPYKFR